MVLPDQPLHEDGEMSERIVICDIAQLIAFVKLQEQVEQLCAEAQSLFVSVAVAVDQQRLPMQPVQPFTAIRDVRFEAKAVDRFFDPERRFRRRPGTDAQRHRAGSFQRLRWQGLQAGDATAEIADQTGSLVVVTDGKVPEPAQVTPSGQAERVRIARQTLDLFSGPFEIGVAPRGLQIQSLRAGTDGAFVGRRVKQAAIDVRLRFESRIEAWQLP